MITYDYKSLIRTGKFSTHYFGGSLLPTLLPRRSRFSNVNIGVNIEEKVERINTSCYPDHIDEQNHLYLYLLHWRKYRGDEEDDEEDELDGPTGKRAAEDDDDDEEDEFETKKQKTDK
ncbi:prothymosin alpha-A isoform X1 [Thunnus maccoyii]|uniref:prothymosin alpha-A isoform X1 n=1 Tax=Thunnus maccoyii TaxID=8240 RepID=UPI001C4D2480|nr:prothymosin alpha-A isoform X1 [Thunnus maccoyii]